MGCPRAEEEKGGRRARPEEEYFDTLGRDAHPHTHPLSSSRVLVCACCVYPIYLTCGLEQIRYDKVNAITSSPWKRLVPPQAGKLKVSE